MIRRFIDRGGLWVATQGALMLAICALGIWHRLPGSHPFAFGAGLLALLLGGTVGLAGAWALGSSLTPFPKPLATTRLVRRGIYAWIRHPLYTSVVLCSAGWALAWGSLSAGGVVVGLALFFDAKARREERWLRAQFTEYAEYAQSTRKFIPGLY